MKKIIGALLLALCPAMFFAQGYRIADVRYDLTGSTKAYALRLAVPIDTDTIFPTLDDLDAYVAKISTQLGNQRVLKESAVTYEVTDDGLVTLTITATDSHNWIIVPYPKYSSSDEETPVELKLKFRHYNFLGFMQTLNFDINWQGDFQKNNKVGFNLDYAFPFKAGPFDAQWLNDWAFSYNFLDGENEVEFSFATGLKLVLPLKILDLEFTAKQYLVMDQGDDDQDYAANGDSLYMTEFLKLAVPFTLLRFDNLSRLYFTPYIDFTYNWDPDGIKSPDLMKDAFSFGATINNSNVDWKENFRAGHSFSVGTNVSFNFASPESELIVPSLKADATFFRTWWNRVGIATRLQAFTYFRSNNSYSNLTNTTNIGSSLRGVPDNQKGTSYPYSVLKTPSAVIVNLDVPVRLFTTDWRGWGATLFKRNMPEWFHIFDFELQLAPFVDIAFMENLAAGNSPDLKDILKNGWYSAGIELLVYPDRWRSLVVRLSAGIDVGQRVFHRDWQQEPAFPLSSLGNKLFTEIYFGVGWFY